VPAVTRLMALLDAIVGAVGLQAAAATAKALGLELDVVEVQPDQFEAAFAAAVGKGDNGLTVFASSFFNFHRRPLIDLALRYRLPSIWEAATYVRDGGLLSYGPSFADMYRRSSGYVAKILSGAKPGDLPVEQPVRFELVANLRTARLLGITLPPTFIARADEVISLLRRNAPRSYPTPISRPAKCGCGSAFKHIPEIYLTRSNCGLQRYPTIKGVPSKSANAALYLRSAGGTSAAREAAN